ncbi:MAG: hypothetical protein MJ229_04475 [bacterium]|nr:hypothetical protein [bacterium]
MSMVLGTVAAQQQIARTSDLDLEISKIQQAKIDLQRNVADLVDAGSDLDPKSPAAKQLEARKEALVNLEKKLDMQLQAYEGQKATVNKSLGYIQQNCGQSK